MPHQRRHDENMSDGWRVGWRYFAEGYPNGFSELNNQYHFVRVSFVVWFRLIHLGSIGYKAGANKEKIE